jgi:hypothetical protein
MDFNTGTITVPLNYSKYRGTIARIKSSLHSQTLNSTELHSIILMPQFNFSASKLISWQAGVSKLNYFNDLCPFCNPSARTTQKTQSIVEKVFTAPLHSNGHGVDHIENTALLLLRAFFSAGVCLPSRCLETVCITPLFCCCRRYIATAAASVTA